MDAYRKDGHVCMNGLSFCYKGECPTLDKQCSVIWGESSRASDSICYKSNGQGTSKGNCGLNAYGEHVRCSEE